MILDFFAQFTGGSGGAGNNDQATDSPTTGTQVSSQILDLHMLGIPILVTNQGARDMGIGDDPSLKLMVEVTTAFTGGTSLGVNFQGAPDNGSGSPGSFTTYVTGPVVTTANLIVGARVLEIDVPRPPPGIPFPRFLQLQYANTGSFTAGKLRGDIVLDRHDQPLQSNATLGGYPPGVVIAN
jgi:hypothetical protein